MQALFPSLGKFEPLKGARGFSTYKPPKAKTPIKLIFCLLGSCSLHKTGIGSSHVKKSVRILKPEKLNQRPSRLKQCPPSIDLSQKKATGLQAKQFAKMKTVPPTNTKPMRDHAAYR
jgi:hypothetical protein